MTLHLLLLFLGVVACGCSAQVSGVNGMEIAANLGSVLPTLSRPANASRIFYGVMFDAGSTGTRIHIYTFILSDQDELPMLDNEMFHSVKPGLSAFADAPEIAGETVRQLLRVAKKTVPRLEWKRTPVVLRATAGLRLLPPKKAQALLDEVQDAFDESPFLVPKDSVTIMNGANEGILAWVTLNYLTGHLQPKSKTTVGILDLGGGSTQITFLPKYKKTIEDVPADYLAKFDLFNSTYELYTHSYLGNGIKAARLAALGALGSDGLEWRVFESSCLPKKFKEDWSFGGLTYKVSGIPNGECCYTVSLTSHRWLSLLDPSSQTCLSLLCLLNQTCLSLLLSSNQRPVSLVLTQPHASLSWDYPITRFSLVCGGRVCWVPAVLPGDDARGEGDRAPALRAQGLQCLLRLLVLLRHRRGGRPHWCVCACVCTCVFSGPCIRGVCACISWGLCKGYVCVLCVCVCVRCVCVFSRSGVRCVCMICLMSGVCVWLLCLISCVCVSVDESQGGMVKVSDFKKKAKEGELSVSYRHTHTHTARVLKWRVSSLSSVSAYQSMWNGVFFDVTVVPVILQPDGQVSPGSAWQRSALSECFSSCYFSDSNLITIAAVCQNCNCYNCCLSVI
ncbi:hypothetical protein ACEWY4_021973 [Coilia grayii]|uniref:nucleoside diphosphate phosphatase n=1 Tax=Coilia grayii TaxID=363190 RepID=A0ABD1J770_9TELE